MKKNNSVSSGTRPTKSRARRSGSLGESAPAPVPPPPSLLERINVAGNVAEEYGLYTRRAVWTFILGVLGDICGSASLTGEAVTAPSVNTWLTVASLRTIAQSFEGVDGKRLVRYSSTRDAMQLIRMMEERPQTAWDAHDRAYIEGMRAYLLSNGREGIPTDAPHITDHRCEVGSAAIFRESPYGWFPPVSFDENTSSARSLMHRELADGAARAFSHLIKNPPDNTLENRLYQICTDRKSPFYYSPAAVKRRSGHLPSRWSHSVQVGFSRNNSDEQQEVLFLRGGHQMLMEYLRERPIAEIVEVTNTGVCATQVLALSAWIRYRNKGDVRAAINEAIEAGVYPATVACLVAQLHAMHGSFDPKQVSDWIEKLGVGDMLLELVEQELLPVLKTVYG